MLDGFPPPTVRKRLLGQCEPDLNSGCWLWTGRIVQHGYGAIYVGRRGSKVGAHRASYVVHNGPIPAGMFVCHRCDTPACINPAHLFLATGDQNMADMKAKGRARNGAGTFARISRDEGRLILRRWRETRNYAGTAREFNRSQSGVRNCVKTLLADTGASQ